MGGNGLIYILTLEREEGERKGSRKGKMLSPISIASPSTATFSPNLISPIPKSSFNALTIQHRSLIRLPLSASTKPSSSSSSSSVVMMAKREEELKEIRAKPTEQLNEEIIDLKGDLLMLRLQKSARNEFKASEFRRMRKKVLSLSHFSSTNSLACLFLGKLQFHSVTS